MTEITFEDYQEISRETAIYPEVTLLIGPPPFNYASLREGWKAAKEDGLIEAWARRNVPLMLDVLSCARDGDWVYPILGFMGEAGELADKLKKLVRDHDGTFSDEYKASTIKELGDPLWYQARLADAFHVHLRDVAKGNLDKLLSRKVRGTLQGSGDDR